MNPWRTSSLNLIQDIIRLMLWLCFALCGAMFAIFAVAWTYQFLRHAWSWCMRVLFNGSW